MAKMKLSELEAMWTAKIAQLGGDLRYGPQLFTELNQVLSFHDPDWTVSMGTWFGSNGYHPWAGQVKMNADVKINATRLSCRAVVAVGGTSRTLAQAVSLIADLQRATELAAYAEQLFDCEIEPEADHA